MGDPSCTRGAPVGRALPVLGSRGSPPPPPTRPGRRLAPSPPLSSFPAAPGMTHFRGGGRQPAHSRALAPAAPRARSPTGSAVPPGGRRATARPPRPSRGWQRPERCRGRTLPPSPPHQKLRSDDGGRNASRSELPRPPAAGSGGAVRGSAPRSLPARARRSVTWPRAAVRIGAAGSGGSRSPSAAGGRGAQLVRCARPAAEPPSPDASSRRSVPELYG